MLSTNYRTSQAQTGDLAISANNPICVATSQKDISVVDGLTTDFHSDNVIHTLSLPSHITKHFHQYRL